MNWRYFLLVAVFSRMTLGATDVQAGSPSLNVQQHKFGQLDDGHPVWAFQLSNRMGTQVTVLTYGGIVQKIQLPAKNGNMTDIVLGYDTVEKYVADNSYLGAIVGRFANRIANASFRLDGHKYILDQNGGQHNLHSGSAGVNKKLWQASSWQNDTEVGVTLKVTSPDGDGGFPGNLDITATYSLNNDNRLLLDIRANTDKKTPVSLTSHSYFNLRGEGSVLNHAVQVLAEHFTPVTPSLIPTGELRPVAGTPFDFRLSKKLIHDIDKKNQQLLYAHGYDHNWVINTNDKQTLNKAVEIKSEVTGIAMSVFTDLPGVQLYTGNFIARDFSGKNNRQFGPRGAICIEPQYFPDSPNQHSFPSAILRPEQQYHKKIAWKFSIVR
ncbi:aldose epimerase family protein [Neptunicella marina]|uniref:Aldose 1-epimerase n=1 Tax=Neptunicella marina TaxID=2125989 RepID=A0A8J6M2P9_9ALTE|nr:aldose epimerase family protein [Neptunicella marina]MBC3766342.1 galactose mutarotase [Neptunicella marina]